MQTPIQILSPFRLSTLFLLMLILIPQPSYSESNNRKIENWLNSAQKDFLKIHSILVTSSTPSFSIDEQKSLTGSIRSKLQKEDRLDENTSTHLLALKVMVLSYQDTTLDVQAELYNDNQFLLYSRVKRDIDQTKNLDQEIQSVSEELLDKLI